MEGKSRLHVLNLRGQTRGRTESVLGPAWVTGIDAAPSGSCTPGRCHPGLSCAQGEAGEGGAEPRCLFPPISPSESHRSGLWCSFPFGDPGGPPGSKQHRHKCALGASDLSGREPIPEWGPDSPGVHQALDLSQMLGSIVFFPLHSETKTWSLHSDGEVMW